jgi:hypothetical protein
VKAKAAAPQKRFRRFRFKKSQLSLHSNVSLMTSGCEGLLAAIRKKGWSITIRGSLAMHLNGIYGEHP